MPLVHELIAATARRNAGAVAAVDGDSRVTFGELESMSVRVATNLRLRGVGRGDRVAVTLRRGAKFIAAVLGVLKAGAVFVPSDIRTPARRLRFVANDASARLIITEAECVHDYTGAVDQGRIAVVEELLVQPSITVSPEIRTTASAACLADADLAYILYTSGSTGSPKGVAISHAGIAGYLTWATDFYAVKAGTGAPLFTSPGFDLTLTSLFCPLLAGRAVTVVHESDDLIALADLLRGRPDFSFIKVTPHHLDLLTELLDADSNLRGAVRCVIAGGDSLRTTTLERWRARAPGVEIVNEYGPTETVVGCAVYRVPGGHPSRAGEQVPIGGPVPGARLYVMDSRLRQVPRGQAGELYVGGPCASGWYHGRPSLTAQRFLPDPFGQPGGRMYRTGDRARYSADGQLEFLGRIDNQAKIRGFRVEPAEVQAVLRSHPEVGDALVRARDGVHGTELVAVVASAVDQERLRAWLAERLPYWMIPARVHFVDALPLTINGKVDYAALDLLSTVDGDAVPPAEGSRSAAEDLFIGLIQEVLHRQAVGRNDNFFELGGDSMRAIQLVARVRKVGIQITPRDIVDHPTAAGLAAAATSHGTEAATPPGTADVTGPVPLTAIQRWFFELDLPEPAHWNQAVLIDLPPGTDQAAMRRAVDHVTAGCDALRMRYERGPDGWTQRLGPGPARVAFEVAAQGTGASADPRVILEHTAAATQAGLGLGDGPLMRVALVPGVPGEPDRMLLVAHHLVVDTVSWHVLVDDLAQAYGQLRRGQPPAPLPASGRYAAWAHACAALASRPEVAEQVMRWRRSMPAATVAVRKDDPRAPNDLAGRAELTLTFPREPVDLLTAVMSGCDLRWQELLLGVFAGAVCDVLGCVPPLVDVEGHGRQELGQGIDVSRTIGWFTALFPAYLGTDRDPASLVLAARAATRAAPLAGLGYGLARYVARVPALAGDPRPELLFNYLGRSETSVSPALGWRLSDLPSGTPTGSMGARPYLLEYHPVIVSGALRSTFVYNSACHRRSTIETIAMRAHELLADRQALLSTTASIRYRDSGLSPGEVRRVLAQYDRRPS